MDARARAALALALLLGSGSIASFGGDRISVGIKDLIAVQVRLQRDLPRALEATVSVDDGASGVIVSRDGYVLTAAHVSGRPGRSLTLHLHDGRSVRAESLGLYWFADAGLLKIVDQGDWPFVPMGSAETSKVGDWCFALGHAGGYQEERGPVVRIGRIILRQPDIMQTDCQLIGGDSGGPLFNLKGEVIGIHSRVSEDIDDNYHAPIEAFHAHWQTLVAGEAIPPRHGFGGGDLGVDTSPLPEGVVIDKVREDTGAMRSGLLVGDVILSIDAYPIHSRADLLLVETSKRPGDEVTIRFKRHQRVLSVKARLGHRYRGRFRP